MLESLEFLNRTSDACCQVTSIALEKSCTFTTACVLDFDRCFEHAIGSYAFCVELDFANIESGICETITEWVLRCVCHVKIARGIFAIIVVR